MSRPLRGPGVAPVLLLSLLLSAPAQAAGLRDDLGRNEVRLWSAPFRIEPGLPAGSSLPPRLERLGYQRVHRRPAEPGEYFWGEERFWIYRHAHRLGGTAYPARLLGLQLDPADGRVRGGLAVDGSPRSAEALEEAWVEPELVAESFDPRRLVAEEIRLDLLPPEIWRAVLAAEDHRFFDHRGIDPRGVARALLRNALAGGVIEGGSTISQQLVKLRDLQPRRTLGRKASEALRALALEAEYEKEEILEAYLEAVYLGHVEGFAVHGLARGARVWFGKDLTSIDLGEAALLAAMIQGPNRLAPDRHGKAALRRQRWVLDRLEELGWAPAEDIAAARRAGLPRVTPSVRGGSPPASFVRAVGAAVGRRLPERTADGRGVVVASSLDATLQARVKESLDREMARLRRAVDERLQAAVLILDASQGDVLAYVGGLGSDAATGFDRVQQARRQPGSTIKPLLLLAAFDDCGEHGPLHPAVRVLDGPVELTTARGVWSPGNEGRADLGEISLRRALLESRNPPFVRLGSYCGFAELAASLRRGGLDLPAEPPPSFVLGSVETSPWQLARMYAAVVSGGQVPDVRLYHRLERPRGGSLARRPALRHGIVDPAAAFLTFDVLRDSVRRGIARGGALPDVETWGKTGTTAADAWFAGGVGDVVLVLWMGRDDGRPVAASGGATAAALWRELAGHVAALRGVREIEVPPGVQRVWIQEATGLRVRRERQDAVEEWVRRDARPPARRLWRRDRPQPQIELSAGRP